MEVQVQTAFQIEETDNVATALCKLEAGTVRVLGDAALSEIEAVTDIPEGHKIALYPIAKGEHIRKYGVVIGQATEDIKKGSWVHLHNIQSLYDTRSSHLDVKTGAPKDIVYE